MTDIECELTKGLYLSNYKTDRPDCECFSVSSSDGDVYTYMSYTNEIGKYITLKEADLREISKKLFPDKDIDPEELDGRTIQILSLRNKELDGAKYERSDGTFIYRLKDNWYIKTVPFLQKQDLSFENPQDLEKIKSYQYLEWPNFSADQTELADLLEAKGYSVKHYGRSGFESRNRYVIEFPDVDETNAQEVIEKINQDIADAQKELYQKELERADQEFAKHILDKDGIFSYMELGGDPSDLHHYDEAKYEEIGSYRSVACQDSRRNISHIYCVLLFDKEKLKKTDKKVIELSSAMGLKDKLTSVSREYGINFKIGKDSYSYIVDGRILENVSHLDLDLNKPEDVEKALIQHKLSWPTIKATSTILKEEMEKKGYVLEHQGRSGISQRNSYEIKTKDGIITPEAVEQITKDLEQAKNFVKETKNKAFDQYFDEQSTDKSKVYAVVETGYNYDLTRTINNEKYERIAQIRIACTQDLRYGYEHTYQELLINKERMKADKRGFIKLEVPKDMIGIIIGKGGSNIKALQQKFGKQFKIVQDPREIEAEKKREQEEIKRKRQADLNYLQRDIKHFMGENFISADDEGIAISMVEYITNNQPKLSLVPTQEELQEMKKNLISERDEQIAEENRRKAEEIARQKRLEEERLAEQRRLEQEKVSEMKRAIKAHIQQWADEHNGKVMPNEEFANFIRETYQEDELAQKFVGSLQKDFLLKMEEERAMQQRLKEADKRFDKVADEEFTKFFEDDFETGGHGYDYFNIVGKTRRASAYDMIAEKIERRLGIHNDLRKPLEERLLDPRSADDRISSYLYEEQKFRDRVVDFNENSVYEEVEEKEETKTPEPAPEATVENLALLWGATLKGNGRK